MIAFLISVAKPMRVRLPMLAGPRIMARLPMRQSLPIASGPTRCAPGQIRVRAPMVIGPRVISRTAVSSTMANGSTFSASAGSQSLGQAPCCACSSRHHIGVPRRLVSAELATGDEAPDAVRQPDGVGEKYVEDGQRRHHHEARFLMMESAD